MGYRRGMSVLAVGDGDFSFSLAVSRLVIGSDSSSDKDQQGNVVATSYEDEGTLKRVYPDFTDTVGSLESYGEGSMQFGYKVDATKLSETLPDEVGKQKAKFHRICWNFPCTAIGNGQDGQNNEMEQNKDLVKKFIVSALPYLDEECGEIHMAHKTRPPFNQWRLEEVALDGLEPVDGDRQLEFKGRIAFDKCILPPYTPRKALNKKSFPCHDACVYVFGWKRNKDAGDSSKEVSSETKNHVFPPTIPEVKDGDVELTSAEQSTILPVTEQMLAELRESHFRYAEMKIASRETNPARKKKRSHQEVQVYENSTSTTTKKQSSKKRKGVKKR